MRSHIEWRVEEGLIHLQLTGGGLHVDAGLPPDVAADVADDLVGALEEAGYA